MSFRETFEACVATLRAHPRIVVTHVWVGEPATDGEIAETEAKVGPLPAPVRAFYKQHNGAQLRWFDRESAGFSADDDRDFVGDYDWSVGCDERADGVFHFVPLDRFVDRSLFHGDDAEIYCAFDDFGDEAVSLRRPARGRPLTTKLALGDDHNVGWDDCPLEFEEYLALTLALYGHADERTARLRGKGDPGWKFPASVLRNALPRGNAATGRRVQWTDERYFFSTARGTLLEDADGPGHDPEKIRILGDLGGVIERRRRETDPLATPDDTYELARSAPAEFLEALLRMPPVAARAMLERVRSTERRHGRYRDIPVVLEAGVFAEMALFAPLDEIRVRDVYVALFRGWMPSIREMGVHGALIRLAEMLTVLARSLPASEIAPIVALTPAIDAFAATLPSAPTPPVLSEHANYWRSLVTTS